MPGAQRRRPRRPPFLRVESEGVGVTSSIRPIFMPERARARRADWAPGPGVLVALPVLLVSADCDHRAGETGQATWLSTYLR